jgi:hypothetical protein
MDLLIDRLLLAAAVLTGSVAVVNENLAAAIVTVGLLTAWAIVTGARLRTA